MDLGLKGKVSIVVGGAGNLGAAISKCLAQEGAKVVISYGSNVAKAEAVKAEIEAAGGEAAVIKADCGKPEEVDALFDFALKTYGRIDNLVYAAMYAHSTPMVDTTLEEWYAAMDVNLTGVFLTNQRAARYWIEKGMPGSILNFSSQAAFRGSTTPRGYYAASKAGVVGFSRSMAHELAPKGILVNSIAPGISGVVGKNITEAQNEHYIKKIPMGRIGTPEEMGKLVAFLVSPVNSYMCGACIDASAGMMMH